LVLNYFEDNFIFNFLLKV